MQYLPVRVSCVKIKYFLLNKYATARLVSSNDHIFQNGIVEILASAKCAGFNSGHIQCMLFTHVKKKKIKMRK